VRDSGVFFAGAILGALFCAACGFDLFPVSTEVPSASSGVPVLAGRASQRLATELAEARREAERLHAEMGRLNELGSDRGDGGSGLPQAVVRIEPPAEEASALAARLRRSIASFSWSEAARRLDELLQHGEEGARLVVETVSAGSRAGEIPEELEPLYPLLRVAARREEETAGLITAALASPAMEEPRFARLVYRLAPPFLSASVQTHSGARSALVQRLLGALEGGSAAENLWWILQALSHLGVDAGVESLARILNDPAAAPQHGLVVVHLGRVASVEAVGALVAFVERSPAPLPPAVGTSLRELARLPLAEAKEALDGFLQSSRREIRDAATLAYFTRTRGASDAARAAQFLDCDASLATKRKLLASLRERSPDLLRALAGDPPLVRTEAARSLLAREELPAPERAKSLPEEAQGNTAAQADPRTPPLPAPLEPLKK